MKRQSHNDNCHPESIRYAQDKPREGSLNITNSLLTTTSLDDTKTPILKTLQEYLSKKPTRMHVPFHTGITNNAVFPKGLYELDISEVSGYDIEGEDNPIHQSEKITANFFNVKHSFYLTGGASIGLLAALIALRKFGKKVIVARNSHKSVINGLVLSGLEPVWLEVDFLEEWGIFSSVNIKKLEKLIDNETNLAGCVIVSPTYEGVISDIKSIAGICHTKDIPLVVDEAHGAHLYFLEPQPPTPELRKKIAGRDLQVAALNCDADIIVQSWHKSLGSLTQSGVLHLVNNNYFTYNHIKRSLDLVSSTSPSFLLLLSLELTRKHLAETKGEFFNGLYTNSVSFRNELQKIENISCFKNDDPFKVYLKSKSTSGIDFAYKLYKEYSIEVESANEIGFLMQLGINFNEQVKNKVLEAIKKLSILNPQSPAPRPKAASPLAGSCQSLALSPRKAFFEGFKNKADLKYDSDVYAPCPPGYAITIPGAKKQK